MSRPPRARPKAPCLCGSGARYESCCQPLHKGAAAPSAEALMRSRYCGYALHKARYILATTHPEGPHWRDDRDVWRREVMSFCRATKFVRLEILDRVERETEAEVEFVAHLEQAGQTTPLRERSVFRKLDGRWSYLQAVEDP